MLNETVARRYCAALFALAKESGTVDTVVNELDAFVEALRKDPDVRDFFFSPVVDRAQKTRLLGDAFEQRLSELTFNFLVLLVRKRRENLVEVVARQMHELLDRDAGRTVAMIATPAPLSPQELADLARRLSNVYRKPIIPQTRVDADLLGGLVVQMGDTYVDASVAGKLEEVRRHLLSTLDTATTAASPNGKPTA
jgi:F-type H+-transporting ATPase subunit delta